MAYEDAPVYLDPPSNNWFGMQAWPMERVAELYYIFVKDGDKTSENVQMAKSVITKWVSYALDYIFIGSRPVSDEEGYFLDEQGQRILGGTNVSVATTSAPGEFWLPGNIAWSGQPDTWNGFQSATGNPNLTAVTKDPTQDTGVLGSLAKALIFFAAATKQETGDYTALGARAKDAAAQLLEVAWNYNDGVGIVTEEDREDYDRFFRKKCISQMDGTGHLVKEIKFLEPAPFLLTRNEEGMGSIRVLLIFVRRLNKIQHGLHSKVNISLHLMKLQANGRMAHQFSLITASGLKWIWPLPMLNTIV